MNDDDLRRLLHGAADPAWDDEVRASSALYAGQRLAHRRRWQTIGTSVALAVVAGAAVVTLLPGTTTPTADVVLGCAQGTGSHGEGLVAAGVGGVTLAVDNPTDQVLPITAGAATVLAVPGRSQVTLPLGPGRATVHCGAGATVQLTVQRLVAAHCTSVSSALDGSIEQGELGQLTRDRLGALPAGAVVDASPVSSPLRHMQVRQGGTVVAEAVWHEMPGDGDWHLESLSRCG
jgi:hypothetical protein